MADALTDIALYSALSEQVYRRAYIDKHADQPLAIPDDGSKTTGPTDQILGQTLVKPVEELGLNTNTLTKDRFQFNNNHIYDTSNGFVATMTKGASGYTVTFRVTDMGDASQWTFATATLFKA